MISNTLKENTQSLVTIYEHQKYPLLVVGTTENLTDLSRTIRSCFRHEIQIQVRHYHHYYYTILLLVLLVDG